MESGFLNKNEVIPNQNDNSKASMECICYRPHSNIICNRCGFWTKGRVRYCCPQHPKVLLNCFKILFIKSFKEIFLIHFFLICYKLVVLNNATITITYFLLQIVFLHDHYQCPRCRSYDFMLKEI